MTVVVDASVAVKWVLDEENQGAAIALRTENLIAPSLWLLEAGSVLWRRARLGHITSAEAESFLVELSTAPVISSPIANDLPAALALANAIRHPIYDCLYLALAIRESTIVVTADNRFVAAVARHADYASRVRLLAGM